MANQINPEIKRLEELRDKTNEVWHKMSDENKKEFMNAVFDVAVSNERRNEAYHEALFYFYDQIKKENNNE